MPRTLASGAHAPLVSLLIIVCTTLAGAAIGFGFGQTIVVSQQHEEAGMLADLWVKRASSIDNEASAALRTLNESQDIPCSDADITALRETVITSRYLKSAAREKDGFLLCSSTLGRLATPAPLVAAHDHNMLGQYIVQDAHVAGVPNAKAIIVRSGNAAVAISHQAYDVIVDPRLDYTGIGVAEGKRYFLMAPRTDIPLDAIPLISGQSVRLHDERYEIRCSGDVALCIIARMRNGAEPAQSPVLLGFVLLGAIAGLGAGLLMRSVAQRAGSMSRRLQRDLQSGKLKVEYQPVVRLSDNRWVGAEALLRWTDSTGHPIDPDLFIKLAEDDGFIHEVSRYVVTRVLDELAQLMRDFPSFTIAVNIAAADVLNAQFASWVDQRMTLARVRRGSIAFEITERTTAGLDALATGIQRLRDNGHAVYIDDFGTHYSSLSYLTALPINAVKLDKTFCRGLPEDAKLGMVASQITAMVDSLQLGLVVEGIEHEPQAAYFRELHPTVIGQGWLFSKSIDAASLEAHLRVRISHPVSQTSSNVDAVVDALHIRKSTS